MALPFYLAMTQGEFLHCRSFPEYIAWMSCSFSPSGAGLSQLPKGMPPENLLMVTDQFPPQNHDSALILRQLITSVEENEISGVILDFQRPYCEETNIMADAICKALPCPVALTPPYIKDKDCIVFVPPVPVWQSAKNWLMPYQGREIWLETEMAGTEMILTGDGCSCQSLELPLQGEILRDSLCRCHYTICIEQERAIFSLCRTEEDLQLLLSDAEKLGAAKALGLYQQQVLFVHTGA